MLFVKQLCHWKTAGKSKIRAILIDYTCVNSILFDPTDSQILCFKKSNVTLTLTQHWTIFLARLTLITVRVHELISYTEFMLEIS